MNGQEKANAELERIINLNRPCRGISYQIVGFEYGKCGITQDPKMWSSMPEEEHELFGLIVHHGKMNVKRVRWHIEHYEELISGVRPMYLFVRGDKKYIVDGCHRSSALVMAGFSRFKFLTYRI